MIKEVLTINVRITEVNEVKGHCSTARMILFDGDAQSKYFTGRILPGGVDTQKNLNKNSTMLSARYILEGTDLEGHPCKIFVENNGVFVNNGRKNGTSPTVYTDSKALAFLEREILYGKVEDTDNGIRIHIYSTGQKLRKKEKSYIAELVATPDKKIERTYERTDLRGTYFLQEEFDYCNYLRCFTGTIKCRYNDDSEGATFGQVDLTIEMGDLYDSPHAFMESVNVPKDIEGNGVGTQMLLAVFDMVRKAKEYFGINCEIWVGGRLGEKDREEGNWKRSVPFYYSVGKKAGVEHYFEIDGTRKHFDTPDEFFASVGNKEGGTIYIL